MKVCFTSHGWDDYLYWPRTDRQIMKRINQLIADTQRNGRDGIGKPEPLRQDLSGWWSRRIDREHRLVYRVSGDTVEIAGCRFHHGE